MSKLNLKPQTLPTAQQGYAMLLGDKEGNQVVDLPIELIDEIDDQPYKIHEDVVERIAESMAIDGQLEPVIVVRSSTKEGRYDLIAGRHRKAAKIKRGDNTIKAIINPETNPDKQRLILLATNNDRNNNYSPSELAFAYLEQMNIMKKLGYTKTTSAIAEASGTNRKSVHKYIQLTNLEKSLLHRVDKGEITVGAGYELSYLSPEKQKKIGLELFNNHKDIHIDNKLARQLREAPDEVKKILSSKPTYPAAEQPQSKSDTPSSATKKQTDKKELNDRISRKIQMAVAAELYVSASNIFQKIVCQFANTKDVVQFIQERYCYGGMYKAGPSQNPYSEDFENSYYHFKFSGNKMIVHFTLTDRKSIDCELTLKEVDYICREYLRCCLDLDEVISVVMERTIL